MDERRNKKRRIIHNGMTIHPIKIFGNWNIGFSLDIHTTSSEYLGVDQYGHNQFDNIRSEIGEAVYQLKYNKDPAFINILTEVSSNAIKKLILTEGNTLDCIIPVPPSNTYRKKQPVFQIAKGIAEILKISYDDNLLIKTAHTIQIKNVSVEERPEKLKNTFLVQRKDLEYDNILLFDDLYQSGSTTAECVNALTLKKESVNIFLITMTKTRS